MLDHDVGSAFGRLTWHGAGEVELAVGHVAEAGDDAARIGGTGVDHGDADDAERDSQSHPGGAKGDEQVTAVVGPAQRGLRGCMGNLPVPIRRLRLPLISSIYR